jgi:hypothetical protein
MCGRRASVELTQADLHDINAAASQIEPQGDRYAPAQMAMVGREAAAATAAS